MKLDLESKMDFDYSIGTEDRFALRKWFADFIESQNQKDVVRLEPFFSEQLTVKGFTQQPLDHEHYKEYLTLQLSGGKLLQVRYPSVKVKFKGFLFYITGSFEGYIDGILSFDGTMDIKIMKEEDVFKIVFMEFYPRMMISPSNL